MTNGGRLTTVGVQKGHGSRYTQYECGQGGLSQGLMLTFTLPACPPSSPSPTATAASTAPVPTPASTGTLTTIPTPTRTALATSTAPAIPTSIAATPTPTACPLQFSDVSAENPFYPFIRCLACRGIVSGYAGGSFLPGNDITRGQIAKIVSNAANIGEDPGAQIYEDTSPQSPFYTWINRLSRRGYMAGYPCGTIPEEPCIAPDNRPYFRPGQSATRSQLAKIVSNAAELVGNTTNLFYTDVPQSHPFYTWVMRLTDLGVMSGYPCGGENEPCDGQNRPYFRPYNLVTRGQASKIIANTFFPGCLTPQRR